MTETNIAVPSKKNNKKAVIKFNNVIKALNNDIINENNTDLEQKHFDNFHRTINNIGLTTPKCALCNNYKNVKKCSKCLSVYYCEK